MDMTIVKRSILNYSFLIREYELVRSKQHPRYRYAKELYEAHGVDRRNFLKYYARYKQSGDPQDLLPRKRGPRYRTRRPGLDIENRVIELREKGNGRYEIHNILKEQLKSDVPSPSGIYNILKRYGLNRLKVEQKSERRKIISKKIGELGHIDVHHLDKATIHNVQKGLYLVCVIDGCSRVAWAEVVEDVKSLTVMFSVLRCFNMLLDEYKIKFESVLTDNGPEFGRPNSGKKDEHPFERMLMELGIKHRYTKPYRPQTNGKVERFWRTLKDDLLEDTVFENEQELKDELLRYLVYYNEHRPHQGLGGITPVESLKKARRNI